MTPRNRLIFALDVEKKEAIPLLDQVAGKIGMVKVNSLAAAWPGIIDEIKNRNLKVWRDWKHHDIPGTVANFIAADIESGIDMTTIHGLGGSEMMQAAATMKEAAIQKGFPTNLQILAITILTSHSQKQFNEELGIPGQILDKVVDLALRAERAGLDGVVASAQEAKALRAVLKPETLIVTPGIKPIWAAKRKDQTRITTPKEAIVDGADYLVVGSAIHKANDPGKAADRIVDEIAEGLETRRQY